MSDPLEDLTVGRGGVPRDGYGRALLKPRGLPTRVPYTSASSLADYIEDHYAIMRWEKRYLARGLGIREDLAAMSGAEVYTTGFGMGDEDENKASGRRLDAIVREAEEAAGIHQQANWGTAVHLLTEPGQEAAGAHVPTRMRADVDAWWQAVGGLRIVATELFVANDALMAAGTFDHLVDGDDLDPADTLGVDCSGTLVVVDKKTGKLQPHSASVQEYVYASAELYDRDTDERQTFTEAFGKPVNQKVALIGYIPAGRGTATLYPLDIDRGREGAELAVQVRNWQRSRVHLGHRIDTGAAQRRKVTRLLDQALNEDELRSIYYQHKGLFGDPTGLDMVLTAAIARVRGG